jgi:Protein of unknown function (DUF3038)
MSQPVVDRVLADIPRHVATSLSIDLDCLLLALESIDLSAVEVMLASVEQLGLGETIPNRVALWRLRSTNPLRKQHQKVLLDWQGAKALTAIAAALAKMLNTYLRLLVNTQQQAFEQKIETYGLQQNLALVEEYVERFYANYRSRMKAPLSLEPAEIRDLAKQLLIQLLFCSGSAGGERLWHNLLSQANTSQ